MELVSFLCNRTWSVPRDSLGLLVSCGGNVFKTEPSTASKRQDLQEVKTSQFRKENAFNTFTKVEAKDKTLKMGLRDLK